MKICIISHEYPPNIISGLGTALHTLSAELSKKGHQITIVTPLVRTNKSYEKHKNIEIIRLKIFQSKHLSKLNLLDNRILFSLALRKFKSKFDFTKFDILHVYDMHDSYFLDKKITSKIPVIISVNDFYCFTTPASPLKFPYPTPNKLTRYLHLKLTNHLNSKYLKKAHHIIANTNYTKNILRQIFPDNTDKKISVIYRGIDPAKFYQEKNKYTSKKILYIGTNMERKGVKYLLEAMPAILKKFPTAKLTIIGRANPKLMASFNKIITKNNSSKNIELIPYIPRDKIFKYYAAANVFVLPAVIENLAVVILEAMASKTPVITTNVGANSEAIIQNKTGILINPKSPTEISNSIINILSNQQLAKKIGQDACLHILKRFNKDLMSSQIISVYKSITSPHHSHQKDA